MNEKKRIIALEAKVHHLLRHQIPPLHEFVLRISEVHSGSMQEAEAIWRAIQPDDLKVEYSTSADLLHFTPIPKG